MSPRISQQSWADQMEKEDVERMSLGQKDKKDEKSQESEDVDQTGISLIL